MILLTEVKTMEKEKNSPDPVPYIVHEGIMARFERTIRRLWIAALITLAALVASNAAWALHFFGG